MKINKFFMNGIILSLPGLVAIIFSLISIPIHLKIAGAENYGNYIIFHFILTMSAVFNFGIGKSIVISIGNFPLKNKFIAYQGLKYTFIVSLIITSIIILLNFTNVEIFKYILKTNKSFYFFIVCLIATIFYTSLEGILQGNEKYKSLSFYNFLFFSLSLTLPSLSLIFYSSESNLDNLLLISTFLKLLTILVMLMLIISNDLIKISNDNNLKNNLRINSRWLTLNNILIQFYDIFDKYLVKIFMGPNSFNNLFNSTTTYWKTKYFFKGLQCNLAYNFIEKKKNQ